MESLTLIEFGLIVGPYLICYGAILCFTAWCCKAMPEPVKNERCAECRLPTIVPQYNDKVTYRCTVCGARWRITVDLTKPRHCYRSWEPVPRRWSRGYRNARPHGAVRPVEHGSPILLVRLADEPRLALVDARDGGYLQPTLTGVSAAMMEDNNDGSTAPWGTSRPVRALGP